MHTDNGFIQTNMQKRISEPNNENFEFHPKKNNCNKMKKGSTFGKLSQSMCFYGVKKCLISFKLSL